MEIHWVRCLETKKKSRVFLPENPKFSGGGGGGERTPRPLLRTPLCPETMNMTWGFYLGQVESGGISVRLGQWAAGET